MKINTDWLSEFVNITRPPDELCERLTMSGLEVESCETLRLDLAHVVVARVISTVPHPESARLVICMVDAGMRHALRIVCGAPNARAGMTTCLALPGARLGDGACVVETVIRGQQSQGMLCSAQELGLGEDHAGLLELPRTLSPGTALESLTACADSVIELSLTPNRGDCLSVLGIARELSALETVPLTMPTILAVAPDSDEIFPVKLAANAGCPLYVGRVIEGVDADRRSPLWLTERLRRCGIRSISPLVDITNYVMLALGQPMHAFDLGTLKGGICVRAAQSGETLALLDGTTVQLEPATMVIADGTKPVALAGIMGGAETGVQTHTQRVFLESAFFDPVQIAGTARQYKIHSDASHRFERGVDPAGQIRALEMATRLVLEICGGRAGPAVVSTLEDFVPKVPTIDFRLAYANSILGMRFTPETARNIFVRLGFRIAEGTDETWQVTPPSCRFDLAREVDLVEELVRLAGYDTIPVTEPMSPIQIEGANPRTGLASLVRGQLSTAGYFEAITYSFIRREDWQLFAHEAEPLALVNPISRDMAVMRSTLWPGLLQALVYNQNRQVASSRLFELGMVFTGSGPTLDQRLVVAGLVAGQVAAEQWGMPGRVADFFDVKQDVENLLRGCGLRGATFRPATCVGLHPGECAAIDHAGVRLGYIGKLHPKVIKEMNISGEPIVFDINMKALESIGATTFKPHSKFPSVRRDIAVVVPQNVSADSVLEVVMRAAGALLRDLHLFDVYQGQGIDSDKKSLALGLIFQAPSSTLTDSQVEVAVSGIVALLSHELGGLLRG